MFRVFITRQWILEPALLDGSSEARNWVESIGRYRSFQDPLNVIDDDSTYEGNTVSRSTIKSFDVSIYIDNVSNVFREL